MIQLVSASITSSYAVCFSPFYYIYLPYMQIQNYGSVSWAMEHNWSCHVIADQYKYIG